MVAGHYHAAPAAARRNAGHYHRPAARRELCKKSLDRLNFTDKDPRVQVEISRLPLNQKENTP